MEISGTCSQHCVSSGVFLLILDYSFVKALHHSVTCYFTPKGKMIV